MIVRETNCQYCRQPFSYPVKPGRPPKACQTCRELRQEGGVQAVREHVATLPPPTPEELAELLAGQENSEATKRERANQRIDNLELMLRSTGSHIQQHLNQEEQMRVPIGYYRQGRKTVNDDWITDTNTLIIRNSETYYSTQEAMTQRNNAVGFLMLRLKPVFRE